MGTGISRHWILQSSPILSLFFSALKNVGNLSHAGDRRLRMSQIAVVKLLLAQKADLIRSKQDWLLEVRANSAANVSSMSGRQEAPEHLTSSQAMAAAEHGHHASYCVRKTCSG